MVQLIFHPLEDVLTQFRITKESFDKDKISIASCQNDGDKVYGIIYLLYCSVCVKNRFLVYLEKQKMEDSVTHFNE